MFSSYNFHQTTTSNASNPAPCHQSSATQATEISSLKSYRLSDTGFPSNACISDRNCYYLAIKRMGETIPKSRAIKAFTLIELSIVLVIIGLLAGGVLVGQDLIKAAEVRAQITQIEKYNTALNTFRVKFNALPGDMNASLANQFNFPHPVTNCDGITFGRRDGNGFIDGGVNGVTGDLSQGNGETALFWSDLSSYVGGQLIDGSFTAVNSLASCAVSPGASVTTTAIAQFIPVARLRSQYIIVYNGNGATSNIAPNIVPNYVSATIWSGTARNLFALQPVANLNGGVVTASTTAMTVMQAYDIDRKIDDGAPASGNVIAAYLDGGLIKGAANSAVSTSTQCYNTATNVNGTYEILQNNGKSVNCALSFRIQ